MKIACPFLVLFVASTALAVPEPVGKVGDLSNLKVTGSKAFTVAQIRAGLLDDMEVQIASTPSAPREAFVNMLVRQATLGYQTSGFPNAKVSATVEGDTLTLKVEEGPQYLCGKMEVTGAKNVDPAKIIQYIKSLEEKSSQSVRINSYDGAIEIKTNDKPSDPISPVWEAGKPATFNPVDDRRLIGYVKQAMCNQGFFWSKVSLDRRLEGNKATLLLQINDEGPRATLAQTEVMGASRNSADEVQKYLGLKTGQVIDLPTLIVLHQKLWNSARFFTHDLLATRVAEKEGQIKLQLALDEHPKAPLLKDELGGEELAILRCRDWLAKTLEAENDLVITGQSATAGNTLFNFRVILHTRGGVLINLTPPEKPGPGPHLISSDFTAVLTQKLVGAYSVVQQQKFVATGSNFGLVGNVDYVASPPDATGNRIYLFAGAGITTTSDQPFRLKVTLAPICFMNIIHSYSSKSVPVKPQLKDGIFTVDAASVTFRFKEQTGELVELIYKGDGGTARITAQPGAMQREIASLDQKVTTKNLYDEKKPLASTVAYISDLLFSSPWLFPQAKDEQRKLASSAVKKLFSEKTASNIEAAFADVKVPQRFDGFYIPVDPDSFVPTSPFSVLSALVPFCDYVFPRQTWPWTMSRETMLLVAGRAKYSDLEARRTFNDPNVGPIGFFAGARLYAMASDGASSRLFAKRGLDRLTYDFFEKDCRTLCDGNSVHARLMSGLIHSLHDLDDKELEAIATAIPNYGPMLRTLARFPKADTRDEQVFPPALIKALWEQGMKEALESSLKDLAGTK